MFSPDEYIPDLSGEPFLVELSIPMNDPANGQMNRLVYFKTSSVLQLPLR